MLNIKITIKGDIFDFSGEAPFPDVRDLASAWFSAREELNLSTVVRSLKDSNDALAAAEAANP